MNRPLKGDCAEYYFTYINQVPDGDIFAQLSESIKSTQTFFAAIPESRADHRYAPDKWSIKQVLSHMLDCERVFSYRAFCMSRREPENLNSMDQDLYVDSIDLGTRTLPSLMEEFALCRAANILMFGGFTDDVWQRTGRASGNPFTVKVFPWILVGHELHHVKVLKERYL